MRLEIPASGPLFEGHFPGRPILPAVALLDRTVRALAGTAAPAGATALRGIANLRLRRPVLPGDVLDVETPDRVAPLLVAQGPAAPGAAGLGRIRFDVRRESERVSDGVVLFGGTFAPIASRLSVGRQRRSDPSPRLDTLLPHRPPMRMVEAIEAESGDGLACSARIPAGSAFDTDGAAPALVALEMAAQTAALFEALRRVRDGGSAGARLGYLVGARDVGFGRATLPVGAAHRAAVRLAAAALPLSSYTFEVSREGEVVASGTLSTWITATAA